MNGENNVLWRVTLFGGLRAEQGAHAVTRFRTQKTGALLAYLAYHRHRTHPREELIDRLWPDADLDAGRGNLRTTLASLRRQLEPPGVPAGAVIVTEGHRSVGLHPATVTTDVAQFEQALGAAERAAHGEERAQRLMEAVQLYRGPLLPGYYDDWIVSERERLDQSYIAALSRLTAHFQQEGDLDRALDCARRGVAADPLREEGHADLMRVLAAAGQPAAALRQYQELERVLQEELGEAPSAEVRALAQQVRSGDRMAVRGNARAAVPAIAGSVSPGAGRGEADGRSPASTLTAPASAMAERGGALPHLPLTFTRFFGREDEIAALRRMLRDSRLVTLTGPGGSGKTRFAVEVARLLADSFVGGVWFVGLGELTEARRIPAAIGDALELPRSPDAAPLEQVIAALSGEPSLLVLDNFEHLVDEGALLVQTLLLQAPALTCLVTSRHRLLLEGEREFPLLPLPVPTLPGTPERLLEFPSVQLFVDRAQRARPDFQITPRNAAAVAALCDKLEGIPLAIELAAAWSQTLTPRQMLPRLERRFELLVSRRRDLTPRHRTLQAAIEWGYQLLPPDLQRFFACLSVFRGGWTLPAAEAVCGLRDGAPAPRLDFLTELCERSLITAGEHGEQMRFSVLETLREFGQEQLGDAERNALRQRHADFFLRLAEEAEPNLKGPEQAPWLDRLEAEHDNFRNAFAWCETRADGAETGLRLAAALSRFWLVRGYASEGREWLARMLSLPAQGKADVAVPRAKALNGAGMLAWRQGDHSQAREFYAACLDLWRAVGNTSGVATALNNLGLVAWNQADQATALACHQESLSLRRALGDERGMASSLNNLGLVASERGDFAAADTYYRECLALRRRLGDTEGMANVLNNLGMAVQDQGDYAAARALYEESLALRRALGHKHGIVNSLTNLGSVAWYLGDLEAARAYSEESLALGREVSDKQGVAVSLTNLGQVALGQGDHAAACACYGESLALLQHLGEMRGLAHCLEACASLALARGDAARAVRLWGAAERTRQSFGTPLPPARRHEREQGLGKARAALGEEGFASCWATGSVLTPEQAVTCALDGADTYRSARGGSGLA